MNVQLKWDFEISISSLNLKNQSDWIQSKQHADFNLLHNSKRPPNLLAEQRTFLVGGIFHQLLDVYGRILFTFLILRE